MQYLRVGGKEREGRREGEREINCYHFSSSIEVQLAPGGVVSEAARFHQDLATVSQQLVSSQCQHLADYAAATLHYWEEKLRSQVER